MNRPTLPPAVRWCVSPSCKLDGIDVDHDDETCRVCDRPLQVLRWTLIICEPRGIYMGLLDWPGTLPSEVEVYAVRSCVFYKGGGSAGLAVRGPQPGSRITGVLDTVRLKGPKTLALVSQEALEAWAREPWA